MKKYRINWIIVIRNLVFVCLISMLLASHYQLIKVNEKLENFEMNNLSSNIINTSGDYSGETEN